MTKKIRVAVLFGGRSAEHEVSLLSAKSIIDAMDKNKYEIIPIGINKVGEWFLQEDVNHFLLNATDAKMIRLKSSTENVTIIPKKIGNPLISLSGQKVERPIDVIFPVLHGPYGEDGTIQGLLKLANIPFVGASVLASAAAMDKDVMKRLFRDAGLPTAKFLIYAKREVDHINVSEVIEKLGLPCFVKPANLGSSVGIAKIKTKEEFKEKILNAFQYDRKILIEEYIPGREMECSVLGNECPIASLPGELIPQHEFYSYEAKYLDDNGALFEIPAKLNPETIERIQTLAKAAYAALCCEGMARVDMFLKKDGTVILNELNTIPGFTSISMYPKLWEASGLPYSQLIDKLIELALQRFQEESQLKTEFSLEVVNKQPVNLS